MRNILKAIYLIENSFLFDSVVPLPENYCLWFVFFFFQRREIQKSSDTKTPSDTDRQGAHLQEERWKDGLCGVCGEEEEGNAEELNCWFADSPDGTTRGIFHLRVSFTGWHYCLFHQRMHTAAGRVNQVTCHSHPHRGNHWQYGGITGKQTPPWTVAIMC